MDDVLLVDTTSLSIRRNLFICVSTALLIGLAAGALVAIRITGPMRQLAVATQRIADGDFSARSQVTRSDEIGQLSQSFDRMAENLQRIVRAGLFYRPGESWAYSVAMDVMGAVLEQVRGQDLQDVLEDTIRTPLGAPSLRRHDDVQHFAGWGRRRFRRIRWPLDRTPLAHGTHPAHRGARRRCTEAGRAAMIRAQGLRRGRFADRMAGRRGQLDRRMTGVPCGRIRT